MLRDERVELVDPAGRRSVGLVDSCDDRWLSVTVDGECMDLEFVPLFGLWRGPFGCYRARVSPAASEEGRSAEGEVRA